MTGDCQADPEYVCYTLDEDRETGKLLVELERRLTAEFVPGSAPPADRTWLVVSVGVAAFAFGVAGGVVLMVSLSE